MTLTFVDAGVLIAAARGEGPVADAATDILVDADRTFASSVFVRLEVLPKAIYHRNAEEVEFYETFFDGVIRWADPLEQIVADAYQEAARLGLASMDSLHLAAAALVGATELVTTEAPTKPIHRSTVVKVTCLRLGGGKH